MTNSIWILVLINLLQPEGRITTIFNEYDSLTGCFQAREAIARTVTGTDYFPAGTQGICIRMPETFNE